MWFALKGDERIARRCATDGCGGQPTWKLESGGAGSYYCPGCKAKIMGDQHCRDVFEENVKYGGMP